ncbi:hypothetical protein TPA0910_12220 [Streptomyces hygroscopicus subsp. sporocinereus]|uniref:Transposase n=1 Tax=Streptomyces hygroscopicus TaxID=1912 RepID=A0ABQ3TTY4_STRHY|nr:hypothetical protein TPA0910_12220 [Streptomyces hygroscopicus]
MNVAANGGGGVSPELAKNPHRRAYSAPVRAGAVRQAEADAGERDDRLTTAEHGELKQLRTEAAESRRAHEILTAVISPGPALPPVAGRQQRSRSHCRSASRA